MFSVNDIAAILHTRRTRSVVNYWNFQHGSKSQHTASNPQLLPSNCLRNRISIFTSFVIITSYWHASHLPKQFQDTDPHCTIPHCTVDESTRVCRRQKKNIFSERLFENRGVPVLNVSKCYKRASPQRFD